MKKFKAFYFENFSFDSKTLQATFHYHFDNEEYFEEQITFSPQNMAINMNDTNTIHAINTFLFHIHLALGISYYKLYPTKKLIIKSGYLDKTQRDFWKKLYTNGLGEFFITNNIIPDGLLSFSNTLKQNPYKTLIPPVNYNRQKNLLLLGGGKDSIVSATLLKDTPFDLFIFGDYDIIKEKTSKIIGKKPFIVTRNLSKNLLYLNTMGYYNGHIPITGMIAFISLFYSYLFGYKNIILSNEKSSDEGNTLWQGMNINHQYSKSLEFEKDFSDYTNKYLHKDIQYFSLLRGMYEYKIAKEFSKQKHFFDVFSSCNKNFTIARKKQKQNWCNHCPKCTFVFLILSNFLTLDELITIFGQNLFEAKNLESLFGSLIGYKNHKPFECVGTCEESIYSFYTALKKYSQHKFYILEIFKDFIYKAMESFDHNEMKDKLSKVYDEGIIPSEFKNLLD